MTKKDYQSPSLKSALGVFTNLYSNLKRREEGVLDDSYDGDADAEDPVPSGEKKRKKKVGVSKKKSPLAIKLKGDEQGIKADKLQFLVRDVIFYIGNQTFASYSAWLTNIIFLYIIYLF